MSKPPRPMTVRRPLATLVPPDASVTIHGDGQTAITGITLDSRDVRPGDLFAALPGEHVHGRQFIDEARENGAVAILTDAQGAQHAGQLPAVVSENPRSILGAVSAAVYGNPGRDMTLIGVTGTNGKTTVTHLLAAGIRAAGNRTGLIGTAGVSIHDEELPAIRTTPEAPDMHALLAVMRERGVTDVVMEVSSHALVLGRVDGLRFDVAGFTNLSPDHLDFHGDMESYFRAKAQLFEPQRTRRSVISVDDEWGHRLAASARVPRTSVSMAADGSADVTCTECRVDESGGQHLSLAYEGVEHGVDIALPGRFNAANAAVAWAILHHLGITDRVINTGFAHTRVGGRMEVIDEGQDFVVIVDYAHSPDAVERVIRAVHADGRRIVVLGCGGDRDHAKRPEMGRIAAAGADVLFICDDNPRSEDPLEIRAQMMAGVQAEHRDRVQDIGDRRQAIELAIAAARAGDVVLLLGKGHETGQEIAGVMHPFDDRVVAREVLAREAS